MSDKNYGGTKFEPLSFNKNQDSDAFFDDDSDDWEDDTNDLDNLLEHGEVDEDAYGDWNNIKTGRHSDFDNSVPIERRSYDRSATDFCTKRNFRLLAILMIVAVILYPNPINEVEEDANNLEHSYGNDTKTDDSSFNLSGDYDDAESNNTSNTDDIKIDDSDSTGVHGRSHDVFVVENTTLPSSSSGDDASDIDYVGDNSMGGNFSDPSIDGHNDNKVVDIVDTSKEDSDDASTTQTGVNIENIGDDNDDIEVNTTDFDIASLYSNHTNSTLVDEILDDIENIDIDDGDREVNITLSSSDDANTTQTDVNVGKMNGDNDDKEVNTVDVDIASLYSNPINSTVMNEILDDIDDEVNTTPLSIPSYPYEQYLVMDSSTNWCADGFEPITSAAECEEYADAMGLTYKATGNYNHVPSGCFIWHTPNVYFSTHATGFTDEKSNPICKPMTSPWSMSPSSEPSANVNLMNEIIDDIESIDGDNGDIEMNTTLYTYEQYLVMDSSTNWCADGFEPITSAAECEEYADAVGLTYKATGNYNLVPSGCFIWHTPNVYFSTHATGFTDEKSNPICKPMTSPWSMSPSSEPSASFESSGSSDTGSDEEFDFEKDNFATFMDQTLDKNNSSDNSDTGTDEDFEFEDDNDASSQHDGTNGSGVDYYGGSHSDTNASISGSTENTDKFDHINNEPNVSDSKIHPKNVNGNYYGGHISLPTLPDQSNQSSDEKDDNSDNSTDASNSDYDSGDDSTDHTTNSSDHYSSNNKNSSTDAESDTDQGFDNNMNDLDSETLNTVSTNTDEEALYNDIWGEEDKDSSINSSDTSPHNKMVNSITQNLDVDGEDSVDNSSTQTSSQTDSRTDLVNQVCAPNNVVHSREKMMCQEACEPRSCCFAKNDNCFADKMTWCSEYNACHVLYGSSFQVSDGNGSLTLDEHESSAIPNGDFEPDHSDEKDEDGSILLDQKYTGIDNSIDSLKPKNDGTHQNNDSDGTGGRSHSTSNGKSNNNNVSPTDDGELEPDELFSVIDKKEDGNNSLMGSSNKGSGSNIDNSVIDEESELDNFFDMIDKNEDVNNNLVDSGKKSNVNKDNGSNIDNSMVDGELNPDYYFDMMDKKEYSNADNSIIDGLLETDDFFNEGNAGQGDHSNSSDGF